jgi:hypothetical protein
MKVSEDLRMYKGDLYYPLCFGEGLITYVKVDMCIEETRKHMSSIDSMVIVNYPNG